MTMSEAYGFDNDRIVMISDDGGQCTVLQLWLNCFGWRSEVCHSVAISSVSTSSPALFIIDDSVADAERTRLIATLRAPGCASAGTPILLLCDPDMADQPGTSGRIVLPLVQSDALAVIENWTGPLGRHDFRALDNPHYRLVRLAGWTLASRLLVNFVHHLGEALGVLGAGQDVRRTAHVVAGLAGPLGFAKLSETWAAIERGESGDIDGAIAASDEVMAQINRWIDPL